MNYLFKITRYSSLILVLFSISESSFSKSIDDMEMEITQHRNSSPFREFLQSTTHNVHVYYRFVEWWGMACLRDTSLDPTGKVTEALLTNAAGFGGWGLTTSATLEEENIYSSMGFLHFWGHQALSEPKGGPKLLQDVWASAQQKKNLLNAEWVNSLNLTQQQKTYPCTISGWLQMLRVEGWSPEKEAFDGLLNKKLHGVDLLKKSISVSSALPPSAPPMEAIKVESRPPKRGVTVNYVQIAEVNSKCDMQDFIHESSDRFIKEYKGLKHFSSSFPSKNINWKSICMEEANKEYGLLQWFKSRSCKSNSSNGLILYEGVAPWGLMGLAEEIKCRFDDIEFSVMKALNMYGRYDAIEQSSKLYTTKYALIVTCANEGDIDEDGLAMVLRQLTYPGSVRYIVSTKFDVNGNEQLMDIQIKVDGSRARYARLLIAPKYKDIANILNNIEYKTDNYGRIKSLVW